LRAGRCIASTLGAGEGDIRVADVFVASIGVLSSRLDEAAVLVIANDGMSAEVHESSRDVASAVATDG